MVKFLTAGIAGHVDHGKTSLVRCLTGIDTDRLRIEKERGLSIESGIAPLELRSRERLAMVDVPGHTDFLKNTIRGLSTVDMGILVVAADDGVMPQTLEHIQILDFFGAKGGLTVLSKADLVDDETLELAELEITDLTEGTFLQGKPVVPFSAKDERGLEATRIRIKEAAEAIQGKVIEIPREKYRQSRACTTISYLKALQENDLKGFMDHFFAANLLRPVTSGALSKETGFSVAEVEAECRAMVREGRLLSFKGRGVFSKSLYQELKENLPKVAEDILRGDALKKGVTAEEIRRQLAPTLDEPPFQRMLAELCNEGRLVKSGGSFRIPNLFVKVSENQEELMDRLLDFAQSAGFVPFSADTFWKVNGRKLNKNEIQRLLDYLHTQGRLIRLNNRRFLAPQAMNEIKDRVRAVIAPKGVLTVGDCKEVLGYGRTVGVPVFEYLDAIGFTIRQGDKRVLKKDH